MKKNVKKQAERKNPLGLKAVVVAVTSSGP